MLPVHWEANSFHPPHSLLLRSLSLHKEPHDRTESIHQISPCFPVCFLLWVFCAAVPEEVGCVCQGSARRESRGQLSHRGLRFSLHVGLLYTGQPPPDAGGSFLVLNITPSARPCLSCDLMKAAPPHWCPIFHSCLSVIGALINLRHAGCTSPFSPRWGQRGKPNRKN